MADKYPNEPRKSKYFKTEGDAPKSKYFREEGSERKSKYFKSEADRKAEAEKSNRSTGGIYHKNAGDTNLKNRTTRTEAQEHRSKGKLPQEITSLDEARHSKGDHSSIFTNEKADKDAYMHYKEVEEAPDDNRRATQIIRTILICIALLIVAIGLNMFVVNMHGEIKFMPTFLTIEFSAIPEFIAALAYGPIVGVAIIVIKNVFHMIVYQSFVSEMSNMILDTFFIFLGGLIYTRRMFNFKPQNSALKYKRGKDYRTRRILAAGFAGTIATCIATFFTTRYISYPLIVRYYGAKSPMYSDVSILASYQDAVERIRDAVPAGIAEKIPDVGTSFVRAILMFNVPLTFLKFLFITIIVALLYPPISDFLHYRVRSNHHHG